MAIYIKISKNDISTIEKKFNIGKIISYNGIKKGIENTNYLLKTKNQKYILTIFGKRVEKKDIPFFINLMSKLNKFKINCPVPQRNKKGNSLFYIKNKPAVIVSFVEGKDKSKLTIKNCYDIGKNVAKLHNVSKKIKLYRKNSMSLTSWQNILNKIGNGCKIINPNLKEIMQKNLKDIKNKWPKNLSNGVIHGDLFIDNIFFKKNKLHGYIDFYFASNDYFMYEIAICINALCFDKKNNQFIFNRAKSKNLIKGYSRLRRLSEKDKISLNVLCRGAALRYLLTRTYDYLNTPKSAVIKIKNPREYIQKLKVHNQFNNFKNYYN